MSETTHLALPYLAAAQAQKHVTHNEALGRLDAIVQLAVLDATLAEPPTDREEGDRFIVAADATGPWEGHDGEVAAWVDGAWLFLVPRPGWIAFDAAGGAVLVRAGSDWVAIGSLLGAVPRLGINTEADDTNRLAVRAEAALFAALAPGDGGSGDVRLVASKSTAGDPPSARRCGRGWGPPTFSPWTRSAPRSATARSRAGRSGAGRGHAGLRPGPAAGAEGRPERRAVDAGRWRRSQG